jgi:hypothetical protein
VATVVTCQNQLRCALDVGPSSLHLAIVSDALNQNPLLRPHFSTIIARLAAVVLHTDEEVNNYGFVLKYFIVLLLTMISTCWLLILGHHI